MFYFTRGGEVTWNDDAIPFVYMTSSYLSSLPTLENTLEVVGKNSTGQILQLQIKTFFLVLIYDALHERELNIKIVLR